MKQIADIMTRDVREAPPDDTLQRAAQTKDELNVGVLPVCDCERLVGIVTDRDITVRGVAAGHAVDATPVTEVMSAQVEWCYEDERIDEVMERMRNMQIRRVPVMNRQQQLVGMVSLGDLATKTSTQHELQDTLGSISSPSEPDRST